MKMSVKSKLILLILAMLACVSLALIFYTQEEWYRAYGVPGTFLVVRDAGLFIPMNTFPYFAPTFSLNPLQFFINILIFWMILLGLYKLFLIAKEKLRR